MHKSAEGVPRDMAGIQGLKPPECLTSLTEESFRNWRKRYEMYTLASGARNQTEEVQVALLLHCIGPECHDIYSTFDICTPVTYNTVIKQFEEYFIPHKNESLESYKFFSRKQKENESFDVYLTELRKLASECCFGELKDRMIKDKIVSGVLSSKLRDKLLRESDLTLKKTILICKAAELATERVKEMEEGTSVDRIKTFTKKKKENVFQKKDFNQKKKENFYPKKNFVKRDNYPECGRCGFSHARNNCPAFGKKCMKCKKIGHFARRCRSAFVKTVDKEEESNSSTELDIVSVRVDNINCNWFQRVYFIDKNKYIKFKIDTGAQCNIISKSCANSMGIKTFDKTNLKLTNYSGVNIVTEGQITMTCKIGQQTDSITFQVCSGAYQPILGLPSLIHFNIVQRIESETDEVVVDDIVKKYEELFQGIGKVKGFRYEIKLKENYQGKIEPCRHVPFKLMSKLKCELDILEKEKIIEKIEKPTEFVSSLVIVGKQDGSLRICLDPQYLNSQIMRENLMLPTLDEITVKLKDSKVFSTLDANKGFFQILLTENSKELTTFNTPFGRYCFNRLPFGLSSSPEIFHRVFSNIFKDIEGVQIFIDDILIHARSIEEHDRILKKVLERAKEYGICFNKKKCHFRKTEVKYLGHILSQEGMKLDKDRIKSIIEMKEPTTLKELLRFLGTINYVSRFIPNVSELTSPLRELNKKDVPFIWSQRQQKAYDRLKRVLCEPPVLAYFDINKPIILSVDASKDGLGAVILQEGKPIAYGSKAMTETEKLYSQIEKESLAILYGCTKFHQYLYGQNFTVESDHKPLENIFAKPLNKSPVRLQRIRLALQPYNFNLMYKPGKELLVADHLSRSYLNNCDKDYNLDLEIHVGMIIESFQISDRQLIEFKQETKNDQELKLISKYVRQGWPNNKNQVETQAKIYFSYRDELSECEGLLFKGTQMIVPKNKRQEILKLLHYSHMGVEKSKAIARKSLFWPNMSKEIEDLVQNCNTCRSYQNKNKKEPMIEKEIADKPWEIVATDIFFLCGQPYLLLVDTFSKFVEIDKLPDLTSKSTINSMKQIFARHGIASVVYSDPGSQFTSSEFKLFSKKWDFEHKIVSAKHHQANGLAERYIQTVKNVLKKSIHDKKDIYLSLLIYRNTPISKDGKTPAELLYNRNIKTILPNYRSEIDNEKFKKQLIERQYVQKKYYDRGSKCLPELNEGEVVKIQDEKGKKPHESGIVVGSGNGPRSYKVKTERGEVITRNRRMLIRGGKYVEKDEDIYEDLQGNDEQQDMTQNNQDMTMNKNFTNNYNRDLRLDNHDERGETFRNGNIQTRSGRIVKRPTYLKDYQC